MSLVWRKPHSLPLQNSKWMSLVWRKPHSLPLQNSKWMSLVWRKPHSLPLQNNLQQLQMINNLLGVVIGHLLQSQIIQYYLMHTSSFSHGNQLIKIILLPTYEFSLVHLYIESWHLLGHAIKSVIYSYNSRAARDRWRHSVYS